MGQSFNILYVLASVTGEGPTGASDPQVPILEEVLSVRHNSFQYFVEKRQKFPFSTEDEALDDGTRLKDESHKINPCDTKWFIQYFIVASHNVTFA